MIRSPIHLSAALALAFVVTLTSPGYGQEPSPVDWSSNASSLASRATLGAPTWKVYVFADDATTSLPPLTWSDDRDTMLSELAMAAASRRVQFGMNDARHLPHAFRFANYRPTRALSQAHEGPGADFSNLRRYVSIGSHELGGVPVHFFHRQEGAGTFEVAAIAIEGHDSAWMMRALEEEGYLFQMSTRGPISAGSVSIFGQ